jgi:hypothetical protein
MSVDVEASLIPTYLTLHITFNNNNIIITNNHFIQLLILSTLFHSSACLGQLLVLRAQMSPP